MDYNAAIDIFENDTKKSVVRIERCGTGIANYVFIVSAADGRFVLRCSRDANAYADTVYWLNKLSVCDIPVPAVLSQGRYMDYSYLILSYICGDDLGNVYGQLTDGEKSKSPKRSLRYRERYQSLLSRRTRSGRGTVW